MRQRIVILGGGISGLALGWFLQRRYGDDIILSILEKSSHIGGWIQSSACESYLFETGPRSCRTKGNGVATLKLVEEIGLQNEVIVASCEAKKRYLYLNGKLQSLPTNIFSFFTSPTMNGIIPALYRDWKASPCMETDESIYDFFVRHLGMEITERLIDPLALGIFAGDIRRLSMRSCFPEIWKKEQTNGSLTKALLSRVSTASAKNDESSLFIETIKKHPMFTFRKGMTTLIQALENRLKPSIHTNCNVIALSSNENGFTIKTANGKTFEADKIFCTLPSHAMREFSITPKISIPMIPYSSVITVNMGWKQNILPLKGFGYLVPSKEKQDILGMVWDSSAFPQQNFSGNGSRITAMLGGMQRPDIIDWPKDKIIVKTFEALRNHLGIEVQPNCILMSTAYNAIPQYAVGHYERLNSIETAFNDAFKGKFQILGSAWYGVSVNDCIAKAKEMAYN